MKFLIPVLSKLSLSTGAAFRNLKLEKNLQGDTDLRIKLWKGFSLLGEKQISFEGRYSRPFFLEEFFAVDLLQKAGVATAEFDVSSLPEADRIRALTPMEVQLRLKSGPHRTSVLFDMIPDKKPGHQYTPILHAGHSAWVQGATDSYAVLLNFRPLFLRPEEDFQKMKLQCKNPQGEILQEREIQVPFNDTLTFSYREEFHSTGGFEPGCSLSFSGGSSQFAIFTVFRNNQSGSIGIEHSLPPYYYCSGVFDPQNRKKFYQRAFSSGRD